MGEMKQHITRKQLKEWSDSVDFLTREKLQEWGEKHCDHFATIDEPKEHGEPTRSIELPLLSIGQMVEFLWEHDEKWELGYALAGELSASTCECCAGSIDYSEIDVIGLCDALWQACKEVLNEN